MQKAFSLKILNQGRYLRHGLFLFFLSFSLLKGEFNKGLESSRVTKEKILWEDKQYEKQERERKVEGN